MNINMPKVIFGTSALGNLYAEISLEEKREIIKECVKHSPVPAVFDTAGKYGAGVALESLGKCLRELNVRQEDVLISNKLGWYRIPLVGDEPTFEPGVWKGIKHDAEQRISYEGILECYEQGNQQLNGYDAAFVSVHDPDEYLAGAISPADRDARFFNIKEAYRALFELKEQGKVKAVGVGAKDWKVIREITQSLPLDWVMIANSMTLHSHPADLADHMDGLRSKGITVINSAVFNGGFLTGGDYYNYQLVDTNTTWGQELQRWRKLFYTVCSDHNVLPAHACVQFGLNAPGVKAVALSTSRAAKVKNNVEMASEGIPGEFWNALRKLQLIAS